jgi:hypothetical protein
MNPQIPPKSTLNDIYDFFKPLEETTTWRNDKEVCVGWQYSNGYMRWYYNSKNEIIFEYIKTN